jgi:hypothetical protein
MIGSSGNASPQPGRSRRKVSLKKFKIAPIKPTVSFDVCERIDIL